MAFRRTVSRETLSLAVTELAQSTRAAVAMIDAGRLSTGFLGRVKLTSPGHSGCHPSRGGRLLGLARGGRGAHEKGVRLGDVAASAG